MMNMIKTAAAMLTIAAAGLGFVWVMVIGAWSIFG